MNNIIAKVENETVKIKGINLNILCTANSVSNYYFM